MSDSSSSFQWLFHGNLVFATGNPFDTDLVEISKNQDNSDASDTQWLGPGLKLCQNYLLGVDHTGIIVLFAHESSVDDVSILIRKSRQYIRLAREEFLCPGFIDLHIHAPQYAYTGTATDRPLMGPEGWLETYTFPSEKRLGSDPTRAQDVYQSVVATTLRAGTTTAVYFATLHLEPCKILVDVAMRLGQRALVGKVCMDRNSPDDYVQTLEENLTETSALIDYIHCKAGKEGCNESVPLVMPIVTPRFIPTCSPQLMQGLGELAAKHSCHVQSHISESIDEVEFSRHIDADVDLGDGKGRSDAEIFDSHKLLTNRCIMAHAVHLSASDMDLMKRRGSGVAHCPLSNFFFAGNSLPCRKLLTRGIEVGLGSDVAGGYSPSMMHAARMAVVASRSLEHNMSTTNSTDDNEEVVMDYRHAFYLATLGGARALGLQQRIGTLAVGMEFDALILSANVESWSSIRIFDSDSLADIFQKLCTLGDDRNVKKLFVQGRIVKDDRQSADGEQNRHDD